MRLDIMEKKGFDKNMQVSHTCDENIKYHTVDDCENFVLEGLPFRKKANLSEGFLKKTGCFPSQKEWILMPTTPQECVCALQLMHQISESGRR